MFNFYQSQNLSCQDAFEFVTSQYDRKESVTCYNSDMLVRVSYYIVDGNGFVVAYIKQHDYDIYGKPYLFCGISQQNWINFKSDGIYNSWGKSFHKYIIDYKCNCR